MCIRFFESDVNQVHIRIWVEIDFGGSHLSSTHCSMADIFKYHPRILNFSLIKWFLQLPFHKLVFIVTCFYAHTCIKVGKFANSVTVCSFANKFHIFGPYFTKVATVFTMADKAHPSPYPLRLLHAFLQEQSRRPQTKTKTLRSGCLNKLKE